MSGHSRLVRVERTPEIDALRSKLPAVLTEQEIVDAVRNNDFSIICGDTGCGKSTQVPQFLYEAGFTEGDNNGSLIGVTQPRRVAAISVAERVGIELNNADLVGYQVRYERKVNNSKMRLKFMTDGILLREIQEDIRLPRYSVIVIDEAHERSINCDMLLGLLSGSIRARAASGKPLKVVIMSATLRMTDFTQNKALFPNLSKAAPAVVQIDNRMHPVIVHYERKTEEEYIPVVVEKIAKIHKTLPAGSILVFVTGKAEVHEVCNAFRTFRDNDDDCVSGTDDEQSAIAPVVVEYAKRLKTDESFVEEEPDFDLGNDGSLVEQLSFKNGQALTSVPVVKKKPVPQAKDEPSNSTPVTKKKPVPQAKAVEEPSNLSSTPTDDTIIPFIGGGPGSRLIVLPLYAQMPSERQMEIFHRQLVPEERVVVVATNVAETSLTIPNVRFVIDCGREKRKEFNSNGVSRFAVRFTPKSSANQRAGRAGRVGPGHVYRMYSPNVFGEHMADFSKPEIETNPLDSAVLFLKSMGVPNFSHFPWPSPPPELHVVAATMRLKAIGALSADKKEKVTELGKRVAGLPVAPRLGAGLVAGLTRADIPESTKPVLIVLLLAVASMLSVDCIQAVEAGDRDVVNTTFSDDLEMVLLSFVRYLQAASGDAKREVCETHGLNAKAMDEARSLFVQLSKQMSKMDDWKIIVAEWINPVEFLVAAGHEVERKSKSGRSLIRILRECFTHSFVDQIAVREEAGGKTYRAPGCSDAVFIHRSSALFRLRPHLLAFGEMQQSNFGTDRRAMRICFAVDPDYLATVSSPLIDRSKPHAMMKPTVVGERRIGWVVPRYIPLSLTIIDCLKVDL